MQVLDQATWRARAADHATRIDAFVAPHLARRRAGVKHPVHDFLFTYYSQRPAQLRRWHPGYGVALADAPEYESLTGYARVCPTVRPGELSGTRAEEGVAYVASRHPLVDSIRDLLVATADRPASFGCFGLHEWAMVHRADETRHDRPLRLGRSGTDDVVESHRIACSHFDAYRFFTPSARPRNTLSPGRDDRAAYEQPGCLHANMDLYKHAFRLSPLIPSELVADAFALAWDIRILDMRVAPYDLTGLVLDPSGEEWTPVRIETPEGKQEYVRRQQAFAERSRVIRRQLIDECDRLLSGGKS